MPPAAAEPLTSARKRVDALRVLGIDEPRVRVALAAAEAAAAQGDAETALDRCEEIAVITAVLTRELATAVGRPADDAAAPTETLEDRVAAHLASAQAELENRIAEIDGRITDAVDGALAGMKAELADEIARAAAPPVRMNDLRKEIAKAIAAHIDIAAAEPASDEAVAVLANSGALKEVLEERFHVMLDYLKNDVIPKEIGKATGGAAAAAAPSPASAAKAKPKSPVKSKSPARPKSAKGKKKSG